MKFVVEYEVDGIPEETDPHLVLAGLESEWPYDGIADTVGVRPWSISSKILETSNGPHDS